MTAAQSRARGIRVSIVTSAHPRTDTRIVVKQARTLAEAGYRVEVVVADGLGNGQSADLTIHDVGAPRGRLHRALICGPQALLRAARLGAAAIHFHDPELLPFAAVLRAFTRAKLIYDVHEDLPRQVLNKAYLPRWTRNVISWVAASVERVLGPAMQAIITVTPTIEDRFAKFHPRVVSVANYPLPEEFAQNPDQSGPPSARACYVGVLGPARGIFEMVRAIGYSKTNARLALGGKFFEPGVREHLEREPGWARVDDLGYLARDQVAELMRTSAVGLVTLQPTPSYVDAYPVKLFEYMCAGLPVIASDFPLWRDIVEGADCGVCVDPTDPKAIADAIDFVITNPDRAREMGENGKAAIERQYSWPHEAKKLVKLYRELIG